MRTENKAYSCLSDPEHKRANGNLKYFEFQLEKQRKAAEEEAEKKKGQKETTKETVEVRKKRSKKETFSLIPERKKYEMLCRGEGIKLVRKCTNICKKKTKTPPVYKTLLILLIISTRPRAGRAAYPVVTLTTTDTQNFCCHLSNSKMSGTAPTLSAILMSSLTKKSRRLSSWRSPE